MLTTIRRLRFPAAFVLLLLAIELLDEIVYGVETVALPLMRDDLALTYIQIGLLLGIPKLVASLIEPFIGILGDTGWRRALILGGGVVFALGLLLVGISPGFAVLVLGHCFMYSGSGGFVSLSQSALMDYEPQRHEQNMVRWTLAGALGVLVGPLLLGATIQLGGEWRSVYFGMAAFMLLLVLLARRYPFPSASDEDGEPVGFVQGVRNALAALRRWSVLRWLILLEFADLMMDGLLGYLALYFVDVVGTSETEAGIVILIWTGTGIVGEILLIPLLERVRGLDILRVTVVVEGLLFVAFLLVEPLWAKFFFVALLAVGNTGWYPILQAQVYSAMPGQSGTVMTLTNIVGLAASVIPLAIGALAEQFGLGVAMWFMLLGPIALRLGLPRREQGSAVTTLREDDAG